MRSPFRAANPSALSEWILPDYQNVVEYKNQREPSPNYLSLPRGTIGLKNPKPFQHPHRSDTLPVAPRVLECVAHKLRRLQFNPPFQPPKLCILKSANSYLNFSLFQPEVGPRSRAPRTASGSNRAPRGTPRQGIVPSENFLPRRQSLVRSHGSILPQDFLELRFFVLR